MKRLAIVFCILTSIIIISVMGINYIENVKSEFDLIISQSLTNCYKKDAFNLSINAKKLSALWESKQLLLSLFIHHNELDQVSCLLVNLSSHIENEDYYPASEKLNHLKFILSHLCEQEKPSLQNIL